MGLTHMRPFPFLLLVVLFVEYLPLGKLDAANSMFTTGEANVKSAWTEM